MFGFWKKKTARPVPTVGFDRSCLNDAVASDVWAAVLEFDDLPLDSEHVIYAAALEGVSRGGDLHHIASTMTQLGMPKGRAGEIACYLNGRAKALKDAERMIACGIVNAQWLWSGACKLNGHQAASGAVFSLRLGLKIGGNVCFPGQQFGCSCVAIRMR